MPKASDYKRFLSKMTVILILVLCPSGCRKEPPPPQVISLEGKVESIRPTSDDTGLISVRFYSEKHKQEMVGEGRVTQETEILIDGVAATLADLRPGDHVRGEVRVEKKGDERIQTAIRIRVERG